MYTIYNSIGAAYLYPQLLSERNNPLLRFNERPVEYGYALKHLSVLYPKDILDVGTGITAWPHILYNCGFHVTAIDEINSYWKGDYFNRHYYVINDDITRPKIDKKFDFITCISVLEHIPKHDEAINGMFNLLNHEGHLLLTFPYNENEYIPNVYNMPGAANDKNVPYICQIYDRKHIDAWLSGQRCEIVDQEYYKIFTGNYWNFGERVYPPKKVTKNDSHQLTCLLIKKL